MKSDIENVLHWLHSKDETHWEDQSELMEEILWDLRRSVGPLTRREKTGSRSAQMPTYVPGSDKMMAAIPHVQQMLFEMRSRNRSAAIESGRLALAALG